MLYQSHHSRQERALRRRIVSVIMVGIALVVGFTFGRGIGSIKQAGMERRLQGRIAELENQIELYQTRGSDGARFIVIDMEVRS